MKPLEEVIRIKEELEKKLIHNPKVSGIDVTSLGKESNAVEDYVIRVMVNEPKVSYGDLGIEREYKGVSVIIEYRKVELR